MKQNLAEIQLIFLVSRGRSGSTLLQSILDAHQEICAPIEAKFVLHLYTKYYTETDWNNSIIRNFINDVYTNRKFRLFWNVKPEELNSLFDKYQINNFSDACKVIYLSHQSMFPKGKIKIIVDKNPLYSSFIPRLLSIFPDAKFIHLIRDPRASTYSHLKYKIQTSIHQIAYDWRLLNEKIELAKDDSSHLFYTIKYEDLVDQPQIQIESIFKFIKIPFSPDILHASDTIKEQYESNKYLSLPQHVEIKNPINSKAVNAWKNKLSPHQINIINMICENQLIKYNYSYQKFNKSRDNIFTIGYGEFRSELTNALLHLMFNIPFVLRVFVYKIVSLLRDKKYTD